MKDKKIDELLEEFASSYDIEDIHARAKKIWGEAFYQSLAEICIDEDNLEDKIFEASQLYKRFQQTLRKDKSFNKKIFNFKQALLFSYRMRPDLEISQRQTYINCYLSFKDIGNDKNSDEKLGEKLTYWAHSIKDGDQRKREFKFAKLAACDQIFHDIARNNIDDEALNLVEEEMQKVLSKN